MRRLQGVLLDHDDVKFFEKTAQAGEAVKDAIGTKFEGMHKITLHVTKEAADGMQDAFKADKKVLNKVADAAHDSLKSSGEAIAATGAAIGAGAANLVTAPLGSFDHTAHKTAKHAAHETKHAVKKAVKGVKKVKKAVAKAVDVKADALEDTAEAAAHSVKRAVIKNEIAEKLAAMKVHKAVKAGMKAVLP